MTSSVGGKSIPNIRKIIKFHGSNAPTSYGHIHPWVDKPIQVIQVKFASFSKTTTANSKKTQKKKPTSFTAFSLILINFITEILKPRFLPTFPKPFSPPISPPGRHPEARELRLPQCWPRRGAEEQKGRDEEIRHDHSAADEGHVVQDPGLKKKLLRRPKGPEFKQIFTQHIICK